MGKLPNLKLSNLFHNHFSSLKLLHKTDIKCHNMTFYCLFPADTGTVGSTTSTGIDDQADRISQINTCV